MKKYYIFLVSWSLLSTAFAQSKCSDADSDMNYAYSHVKSAYDSNNISDLKYFAYRSLDAMNRAVPILRNCGCEPTLSLIDRGIDLLKEVDPAETWEDGRFYVKRARDIAREAIATLDQCTQITVEEEELLSLEMEQNNLKQKQLELERQQKALQDKLIAQQKQEMRIQKEILVTSYDSALTSNLKSYNEAFVNCNCGSSLEKPAIIIEQLMEMENKEIKEIYVDAIRSLSNSYILKLESCLTREAYSTVDD